MWYNLEMKYANIEKTLCFRSAISCVAQFCFCMAAFLFAAFASAADDITAERYPDADTVVVCEENKSVYQADGTYVEENVSVSKVLTERGKRNLSMYSIFYSRRYGTAEVVSVEVIGEDGSVRKVDLADNLKDATDNSYMGANIYDPMDRVISFSVPGLEIGDTLRVVTKRITTAARMKDSWADMYILQSSSPVIKTTFVVDGPIERPLKSIAICNRVGDVESSVVTNGNRIVYSWTARNVPQMFPEPSMPVPWTKAQSVKVSTSATWQEVSSWYWDVCVPHLERTNAAMTNKVEEIVRAVGKKAPDRGLLNEIFKFVSQEIRYMGLTMEDTSPGSAPHDVNITFDNRYGVCRDKAALLASMLRIAGFEAYPVLIRAGRSKMDQDIPQPFFNHAVTAVREGEDYVLMDPTDESSRDLFPSYLSDCSYLVATPDGDCLRTSPVPPAKDNVVKVDGSGVLARDGSLVANYSIAFRGLNDNIYRSRLLSMKPEDRRRFFEKLVAGVSSGAELLKCEILPLDLQDTSSELVAELLVKYPEVVLKGETRDELSVPSLSSALGYANRLLAGKTALEKRVYPLALPSTASTDERMDIDLEGSLGETIKMPEDVALEGKYAFSRSFKRDGDSLVFVRRLAVDAVEFSPDEYLELREDIKRVEASEREKPTFAKNRLSNANERIVSRRLTFDLDGDSSWVSTNTVVKEVLTYKGKKSAAELMFAYNPSWETVELVSAVVSNRNGSVARVGEKEINVMDADWVSAAPRYPASKTLVVNLPSVEVGSFIEYTTVTKVRNAPVPFYMNFMFDSFTPVDFLSVRVGDFKREVASPKLLVSESMLPPGVFWRDHVTISSNSFEVAAKKYRALDPEAVDPEPFVGEDTSPAAIRNWMAKNVRVDGPSLFEVRLEDHVVDPEIVLRERYATRLGYIRTLCALMKGAGHEADIVFAGNNAALSQESVKFDIEHYPRIAAFGYSLCRVRVREGGFLWWGGTTKTLYFGCENEYTPVGTSDFDGAVCLDPSAGEFFVARVGDEDHEDREEETFEYSLRVNGSVDLDYSLKEFGASVGAMRKKYAEMLPEKRSRHFQAILGGVAQSASATRDLMTDVEGYPFTMSFSAFIPEMATCSRDSMSFKVPDLATRLFSVSGSSRVNPIWTAGATGVKKSRYVVRFPEGYTKIEHVPSELAIRNPNNPSELWFSTSVKSSVKDGAAVIEIEFDSAPRRSAMLSSDKFALLREWNRIAGSCANSTIVVRR